MGPIKYRTTTLNTTKNAKKYIEGLYLRNEKVFWAWYYMGEKVRTHATPKPKFGLMSLKKWLAHKFRPTSQLNYCLDKESNGGFFISATRSINNLIFTGKKVPIDFISAIKDGKIFDDAITKAKGTILEKLSLYNKKKNIFKF